MLKQKFENVMYGLRKAVFGKQFLQLEKNIAQLKNEVTETAAKLYAVSVKNNVLHAAQGELLNKLEKAQKRAAETERKLAVRLPLKKALAKKSKPRNRK
jgi:septal ring factor EnvC (AmiA/AmiB activator)